MNDNQSKKHLDEATQFDFSINKLQQYYDDWASEYNTDVNNENYIGPQILLDLAQTLDLDKSSPILDAGCGTGLLGKLFKQEGFQHIDGFDLSAEMVSVASQTNSYHHIQSEVDVNKVIDSYPPDYYSCIICCGVFTLGHIRPDALLSLLKVCHTGGYIVISTRTQYNAATNYLQYSNQWCDDGIIKLIHVEHERHYHQSDTSSYWIYQKP